MRVRVLALIAFVFLSACREEWLPDYRLTVEDSQNRTESRALLYNAFTRAPKDVIFADSSHGILIYSVDNLTSFESQKSFPFTVVEEDDGNRFSVRVVGENGEITNNYLELQRSSDSLVRVRLSGSNTWVTYRRVSS